MTNGPHADLTGFASLLGDSFSSKIDLLEKIIKGNHYPSLGKYKERLLADIIKSYIPKKFEVGNGFVLFVHEATDERKSKAGFDDLNMGSFIVSRECDLIIYDSANVPVIFRDGEFVVVRPESVRAVVEVKGTLRRKEVAATLEHFLDFGRKWRTTQLFYKDHHQPLSPAPYLYAMCWDVAKRPDGKPVSSATSVCRQIAKFYSDRLPLTDLKGFPRLERLFLYDQFEISETGWGGYADQAMQTGYSTASGRFARSGNSERSGDRTVASLLASLHYATAEEFNRFYSYADESRENIANSAFFPWLTNENYIRDGNTPYVIDRLRHE